MGAPVPHGKGAPGPLRKCECLLCANYCTDRDEILHTGWSWPRTNFIRLVTPHLKGHGRGQCPPTKVGPLTVDHGRRAPEDLKHSMSCRFCQGCLAILLLLLSMIFYPQFLACLSVVCLSATKVKLGQTAERIDRDETWGAWSQSRSHRIKWVPFPHGKGQNRRHGHYTFIACCTKTTWTDSIQTSHKPSGRQQTT